MKYTNTRRAAIGSLFVMVLGCIIFFRNAGREFTQRDYMLIAAAVILVSMNVAASYYMDFKNHEKNKLK